MMKNFNYLCLGLLISVGLFFVPYAHSQTYLTFDTKGNIVGHFSQAQVNVLQQQTGVNWATGGTVDQRIPGAPAPPASGSSVRVPVTANRAVSNAAIARAAGKVVTRGIPGVAALVALEELIDMLGDKYSLEDGVAKKMEEPGIENDDSGTGYAYNGDVSTAAKTPQQACTNYSVKMSNGNPEWSPSLDSQYRCTITFGPFTPYNAMPVGKILLFYIPTRQAVSEVDAEARFNFRFQNGVSSRDTFEALRRGESAVGTAWSPDFNPVNSQTPVTITAPETSSTPRVTSTSTRTNPDGSTDTTTTTQTTKVSPVTTGTTVGDSKTTFPTSTTTTSTTTNNITNNTTTTTTTVNHEDDEKDDEDLSFVDKTMPDQPTLYTQKYPDGIAGVWRDHKPNLSGTQFWQGVTSMFPSIGSGGSCPAWSMSFNIMNGVSFGSVPFDVPCWIWQAIGLILLTTAAFTARKIII